MSIVTVHRQKILAKKIKLETFVTRSGENEIIKKTKRNILFLNHLYKNARSGFSASNKAFLLNLLATR